MLLSLAQAPPSVSWRPQVSATMVSRTLPQRRHQPRAGGEVDVALLADGVLRAVAVGVIVRVVEERVDGLVAVQIDDAEDLARVESRESTVRRREYMAVDGSAGSSCFRQC